MFGSLLLSFSGDDIGDEVLSGELKDIVKEGYRTSSNRGLPLILHSTSFFISGEPAPPGSSFSFCRLYT
jgi:hypothetical protein